MQIISAAEARGHHRLVEMNQHVIADLDTVITALNDDPEEPADAG